MNTPTNSATSVTLLGRLAGGEDNQDAWREFVARYGPTVLRWCRRCGCPEDLLEDLLQEILIKLKKQFARFQYDPGKSFRSWLMVVTRSVVSDAFRSTKYRLRGSGDTEVQDALANIPAGDDLGADLHAEFQRELFDQACLIVGRKVKPATWRAFELIELQATPPGEAAAELGMTVENLYVAKSRVVAHLRAEVARMQRELEGETE
jgi:RNA polymerase sigma-70 factor (ECF subfamily)